MKWNNYRFDWNIVDLNAFFEPLDEPVLEQYSTITTIQEGAPFLLSISYELVESITL
jgi:hypothetical protein